MQGTRRDRRAACIGIVRSQDGCAGADLADGTGAGNHPADAREVGTVEGERGVVGYVADDAAGSPAVAELQGARRNRRAARIGIVRSQDRRAGTSLVDSAIACDHRGELVGAIGVVEIDRPRARAELDQRRIEDARGSRGVPALAADVQSARTGSACCKRKCPRAAPDVDATAIGDGQAAIADRADANIATSGRDQLRPHAGNDHSGGSAVLAAGDAHEAARHHAAVEHGQRAAR